MIPEFRDFILPKPPEKSLKEIAETNPILFSQICLVLDDIAEIAEQYGTVKDKGKLKENLMRVIDAGIAALGMDEHGNLTIYMWNYAKAEYLPVTEKYFDSADMATMLRVNQIMLSVN